MIDQCNEQKLILVASVASSFLYLIAAPSLLLIIRVPVARLFFFEVAAFVFF